MILKRFRAWRRRREHIRQEQQALNAMPRLNIDGSRLRPLTRRALDELFRSPAVNAEWPEMKASFDRIVTIEDGKTGGVNPGDRRALYFLVRALRPRRVLEIGTHVGASTMHIAAALKKNGAVPGEGAFITVDIHDINAPDADWRRAGLPRSPRDSLAQLGAADGVQFITMPALRYFDQVDKPFDLIFLDGDHSAAAVYQEISCALAHLCDGGTVVIHDFFPKQRPLWNDGEMVAGPSLAVQRCRRDGIGIVERPLRAMPWPTKLGSNVTSLALLTRR